MCRNIKLLYNFEPPATHDEIHASALQYVRKVTGMRNPSQVNRAAFDTAVDTITELTKRLLLEELDTAAAARDREVEAQKARERGKQRERRLIEGLGR
jgi:hypothetical protein